MYVETIAEQTMRDLEQNFRRADTHQSKLSRLT